MTFDQALRLIPADLIVKLGRFCDDGDQRQCVIHKGESQFKLEYKVQELVQR